MPDDIPTAPAVKTLPPTHGLDPETLGRLLQSPEAKAILATAEQKAADLIAGATLPVALRTAATPGWKTSEFWMTALGQLGLVLAACDGVIPVKYAALAAALSQIAYGVSRGLAKHGTAN